MTRAITEKARVELGMGFDYGGVGKTGLRSHGRG